VRQDIRGTPPEVPVPEEEEVHTFENHWWFTTKFEPNSPVNTSLLTREEKDLAEEKR
jgi:hypothetical protein